MLRKLISTTAVCLAAAAFTPSIAQAADGFTLPGKPVIAMLMYGPKNDGGWTQAFEEARVKLEASLGHEDHAYVENITEDASVIKPGC